MTDDSDRPLTPKESAFLAAISTGMSARQAVISVLGVSKVAAGKCAWRLMKNRRVLAALRSQAADLDRTARLSRLDAIQRAEATLDFDVTTALRGVDLLPLSARRQLKKIKLRTHLDGTMTLDIEATDKLRALEILAKLRGWLGEPDVPADGDDAAGPVIDNEFLLALTPDEIREWATTTNRARKLEIQNIGMARIQEALRG